MTKTKITTSGTVLYRHRSWEWHWYPRDWRVGVRFTPEFLEINLPMLNIWRDCWWQSGELDNQNSYPNTLPNEPNPQ
jgi:hypothetical protein